jgi:hypothetical protein
MPRFERKERAGAFPDLAWKRKEKKRKEYEN